MARSELGSHNSRSSAQNNPQNHTERMKSVHLPHKFLELNSLTEEKSPDGRRDTCVTPWGPSSLSPAFSLLRPPGSCSRFLGDLLFAEYLSLPVILSHRFLRNCPAIQMSTIWCRTTVLSLRPLLSSSPLAPDKAVGCVLMHSTLERLKRHRLALCIQRGSSEKVFGNQRTSCDCTAKSSFSGLVLKFTRLLLATNSCIRICIRTTQRSLAPLRCCSEQAPAWCCPRHRLRVQAELTVLPAGWAGGIQHMVAQVTRFLHFTEIASLLVAESL